MKRALLFILLFTLILPAIAQNEIHLMGKDTVIYASTINYHYGIVRYFPVGGRRHYKTITWDKVEYISIKNHIYGLTKYRLIKINRELLGSEISRKGALDACKYYTKYKDAQNGVFFASFAVGGILGIIPAIAVSGSPPLEKNLNIPDTPLKQDYTYGIAYAEQAQTIKRKAVWNGYSSGILAAVMFCVTYAFVVK